MKNLLFIALIAIICNCCNAQGRPRIFNDTIPNGPPKAICHYLMDSTMMMVARMPTNRRNRQMAIRTNEKTMSYYVVNPPLLYPPACIASIYRCMETQLEMDRPLHDPHGCCYNCSDK